MATSFQPRNQGEDKEELWEGLSRPQVANLAPKHNRLSPTKFPCILSLTGIKCGSSARASNATELSASGGGFSPLTNLDPCWRLCPQTPYIG